MGTSVTPDVGALVLTGLAPTPATALQTTDLAYRLVIVPPGISFTPGTQDPLSDELFSITSRRRVNHPWLAQEGSGPNARPDFNGRGQKLEPATGAVTDGEYHARVIDVPGDIVTVSCDRNDPLLAENDYGLDVNAFSTGGWTRQTDQSSQAWAPYTWWAANADGPYIAGSALFFWVDDPGGPPYTLGTWVRSSWIEKTFDGTEGGGAAWTPGQIVGFHFRSNWLIDTGAGNIFAEANGDRVSFPNGSYDFWTIDPSLASNVVNGVLYTTADANGEVLIKLGVENLAPSCNINCSFTGLEFVSCTSVASSGGDLYVTEWLADADARQRLLGCRTYLEESRNGGQDWITVVYAGYVKAITLDASLTYVFALGDAGRGRRVSRAWANLDPITDLALNLQTVLPGVGQLTLTGFAPTVSSP